MSKSIQLPQGAPPNEELIGATILSVIPRWDGSKGVTGTPPFVRLRVRYADGIEVNGKTEGYYEIWRDEEGNGPGELAFLGANPDKEGGDVQEEEAVS